MYIYMHIYIYILKVCIYIAAYIYYIYMFTATTTESPIKTTLKKKSTGSTTPQKHQLLSNVALDLRRFVEQIQVELPQARGRAVLHHLILLPIDLQTRVNSSHHDLVRIGEPLPVPMHQSTGRTKHQRTQGKRFLRLESTAEEKRPAEIRIKRTHTRTMAI